MTNTIKDFTLIVRNYLDVQLNRVRQGLNPEWKSPKTGMITDRVSIRTFFYICRQEFFDTHPGEIEIDIGKGRTDQEVQMVNIIKQYLDKFKSEFNLLHWVNVRDLLGIDAKERAVEYKHTETTPTLFEEGEIVEVVEKNSFSIIAEKELIASKIHQELNSLGYHSNLIVLEGFSVRNVIKALQEIKKQQEVLTTQNFYVLLLHDYDISGLQIIGSAKTIYPNIIDIGVNDEFLQTSKINLNDVKESWNPGKRLISWLKKQNLPNFKYLFLESNRVEIDPVFWNYGLSPFIQYIESQIKLHCKFWNLNRIDVVPIYDWYVEGERPDDWEEEISIGLGLTKIRNLIDLNTTKPFEEKLSEIEVPELKNEEFKELRQNMIEGNKFYDGNILEAGEHIEKQEELLQEKLNEENEEVVKGRNRAKENYEKINKEWEEFDEKVCNKIRESESFKIFMEDAKKVVEQMLKESD